MERTIEVIGEGKWFMPNPKGLRIIDGEKTELCYGNLNNIREEKIKEGYKLLN